MTSPGRWIRLALLACACLPSCRSSSAPPLAGEFVEPRYTSPDGQWSVEFEVTGLGLGATLADGSDGTGGWFVTWHEPGWGWADVWVAPVATAGASVEALGGVERLADNQSNHRVRELEAAGATVRVLSRARVEVHGRPAVRHVYETHTPGGGPAIWPLLGLGRAPSANVEVVDVVDWGDALVRFSGVFELQAQHGEQSAFHASPVVRAQALIARPQATFARPATSGP